MIVTVRTLLLGADENFKTRGKCLPFPKTAMIKSIIPFIFKCTT